MIRVGACQYEIRPVVTLGDWQARLDALLEEARRERAQLVVLPEYASMELTSALPAHLQGDLARELEGLQAFWPAYVATCATLAREKGLYLLAGSMPEHVGHEYRNRARLHGPDGGVAVIEKLQMTRFERERWGIAPGHEQHVIETDVGTLGVAICYDAEFPLLVRRLVANGADVVLVPSCTDTPAGYARVRIASQARALENQCYVVQAPTVGSAPWSIAVDDNIGAAGVFGPPDRGFPDDGVLAIGERDRPGWVWADLDPEAVARVRRDGQVLGHRDWDLPRHVDAPLTRVQVS